MKLPRLRNLILLVFAAAVGVSQAHGGENRPVDFQALVAPLLAKHCIRCHSPGNRQGDLSLATIADLASQEHLVAGSPDSSYLLEVVTASPGEPPLMPKEGAPLTAAEVSVLRQWIIEGAEWPDDVVVREISRADATWWSLQPLRAPAARSVDEFILEKLAEHNLSFRKPADRRTLIRRATYDLLGLPPTPAEVDAFLSDRDPRAYENLLDRLLASPHYGERWARHWLDVVRFGESNGFERNVIIDSLWPFRDYVIRSLNDDKPFDQFIREHLAGDIMAPDDPAAVVGTSFLVAGPYDDVGNQDAVQAAQIRANTLDEIISATGQAFLGMTLGCSRCHDHKFDPITQRDYYGLYATFAGVRHGAVELATPTERAQRDEQLAPLRERRAALDEAARELRERIIARANSELARYEARWTRPPVSRTGTEERFAATVAKFVRLVCEAQDQNPTSATGFRIDEFEVWSAESRPRNVALASEGAVATGKARQIEDFPDAYGPQLAIDGTVGARFIATGTDLTIEMAEPTSIDRVVFSSARGEQAWDQPKFVFVAEYRIEVSADGKRWREVAAGRDREPVNRGAHLEQRLLQLAVLPEERAEQQRLDRESQAVRREMAAVSVLPLVWIGTRNAEDAAGPFHVFLGGDPQQRGAQVVPASLAVLDGQQPGYRLAAGAPESERRTALADWIVDPSNPLTARVLANRLWHYHFGTGIVDTPSDFGYMGGRPSHPELLDFLAIRLQQNGWRLKEMHRLIMTSQAYRQSSDFESQAANIDGDSRLLWRFPPRRLAAEEIRDTILAVSGQLDETAGGPGFRLYHFMQDNVCTYVPLDRPGPATYRRAVYHQNARASVVDLMTEFDQPDCAFAAPRRAETTTPLQALTMLNHGFTMDMSRALARRLERDAGHDVPAQIRHAYRLCYARQPTSAELDRARRLVEQHGLAALCRVLLNTSELIFLP